jgi:hypothetical protein
VLQVKRLVFVTKKLFFAHPIEGFKGCSFTTYRVPDGLFFCCNSKGVFSRTFHGMFFYYRFQIVAIFLPLLHVFLFVVFKKDTLHWKTENKVSAVMHAYGNPVYGKRPAPGCSCSEQGYLHTFGCGYTRMQRSVKRARNDCILP